ncbi:hypothetical protein GGR56DRAFT_697839 [Xylariaceae sp. FL0804]|nr:hypothetical protein GGR56DRAFT_697839 [Xylariaceae sp. FL0804]
MSLLTRPPVLYSLYVYVPNKGAPIFFTVAYAISTIFHIWQCYRYKAWKLIGLHPLCAVLFTAGYALRDPLLELSNYHVLGRLFFYVPHCAPLPPSKVLGTFGGLMGLVETLNALGVSLSSNPSGAPATRSLGSRLTVAALSIQLGVIAAFVCLAAAFHRRCASVVLPTTAVPKLLRVLYASTALILARCVYRLVEHGGDAGDADVDIADLAALRRLGPVLRYEGFFYAFEATLMLANSALWNVWHPGPVLPRHKRVHLAPDGTEVEGPEERDERPLWAKEKQAEGRFHELDRCPAGTQ